MNKTESKTTHTPGPGYLIVHAGCRGDCKEYPYTDWCRGCLDRKIANDRLHAAAPDLLEAAKLFLSMIKVNEIEPTDSDDCIEDYRKACAAIAKAEGK